MSEHIGKKIKVIRRVYNNTRNVKAEDREVLAEIGDVLTVVSHISAEGRIPLALGVHHDNKPIRDFTVYESEFEFEGGLDENNPTD